MNQTKQAIRRVAYSLLYIIYLQVADAQELKVESLTGPVTKAEADAFKNYMLLKVPAPATGPGNIWVFGPAGKAIEACGLMYEATEDTSFLNRMIYYCDAALSTRNDLAPAAVGGQSTAWTGAIEPIWPSSKTATIPAQAGVEQGSVIGHMAYCARLILQHPELTGKLIPDGDPKAFGKTYRERALKYIKEGDYVIDNWILPRFINTKNNIYYFPGPPNTYKPNEPAPWNQAFMVTNALIRLTQCHLLLKDEAERIRRYDAIVQPNLRWFLKEAQPQTSPSGSECRILKYAYGARTEDANHFAYDVEGLWIAYSSGRYGITFNEVLPFANTYTDIILKIVAPDGTFAGILDGTTGTGNSGGDKYVRDEYFYLAEFRPDQFEPMAKINIAAGKIATYYQGTARLLWEKDRRYKAAQPKKQRPGL